MVNLFELIPDDLEEEFFERLLETDTLRIERIISKGHKSAEGCWYNQDTSEWVLLLKGAAVIAFDKGEPISLKAGDFIDIPAHKKHRVEWTDPDAETIWLAVHYK